MPDYDEQEQADLTEAMEHIARVTGDKPGLWKNKIERSLQLGREARGISHNANEKQRQAIREGFLKGFDGGFKKANQD